jgi:Matrixin
LTKKTIPLRLVAEATRRVTKLSMALVLITAVVAGTVPGYAAAQAVNPSIADSDGYVPVYEVCLPEDPSLAPIGGHIGGGYIPLDDGFGGIEGVIILNVCALEALGAGPNDIETLIAHEMGHAMGLEHSDDPGDLMYWAQPITGT